MSPCLLKLQRLGQQLQSQPSHVSQWQELPDNSSSRERCCARAGSTTRDSMFYEQRARHRNSGILSILHHCCVASRQRRPQCCKELARQSGLDGIDRTPPLWLGRAERWRLLAMSPAAFPRIYSCFPKVGVERSRAVMGGHQHRITANH